MSFRYVAFLICALLCSSCDFFSYPKKNSAQALDTIVDFTKVDISPSFYKCKDLLDEAKANCFRKEIHRRITTKLKQHNFVTKNSLDEEVLIDILINKEGEFVLVELTTPDTVTNQLPELDSIVKLAIEKLPRISPATKRGIPVVTKYQLPIKIKTE
ncbi:MULTISPECIES: hypothetical protein [Tenacibaculum]|uniref:TonB C-terminal domain-containing protein n=1 Tax=Tenacibaculum discolor TaxID=361581 RepID=A0A2G1BT82_9FLAO|nr:MULTISPECIES: hypothetical protein [Tenacibaculum]MDP2542631.1 hypothetical protein [Tenacibaculum discolor]NVK08004.1 hypothetical protein [Tenacibaculum sp.]PHN97236.1 hypothetical protein CSC81_09105 [Tenacibaculum discolor]RLJ98597.1 hypothetical protein C8N27_2498 [Tenacibaculum discolor]